MKGDEFVDAISYMKEYDIPAIEEYLAILDDQKAESRKASSHTTFAPGSEGL